MPQIQLPIFPASSTAITDDLAFERRDEQVFYFNGHLPVFSHAASDLASFRLFSSQLIANGTASQAQISRLNLNELMARSALARQFASFFAQGVLQLQPHPKRDSWSMSVCQNCKLSTSKNPKILLRKLSLIFMLIFCVP